MNLTEKVAYIKGLMEGMKLDETKDEVKIVKAITDLLEDMALTLADVEETCDENSEIIDVLDEDLGEIEEIVYGDCSDDCCDCEDYDGCDCCDCDDFDDEDIYEVSCPNCTETICLNEDMLDEGSIKCPNCDEKLEFDFTGEFGEEPMG